METIVTCTRKARKEHVCDTCGSKIYKGEEYDLQTNKDEGTLYTWKSCHHCKPLVRQMWAEGYFPDGYTETDFENFLADHPEIGFKKR